MENVDALLRKWGLPEIIIQNFNDSGYDVYTLEHADHDDLKELFPGSLRAHLVKFKIERSKWTKSRTCGVTIQTEAASASNETSIESPRQNVTKPSKVVKKNPNGSACQPSSSVPKSNPKGSASQLSGSAPKPAQSMISDASGPTSDDLGGMNKDMPSPDANKQSPDANKRSNEDLDSLLTSAKRVKDYDLKSILQGCKLGRDLMAYFKKYKRLDDAQQDQLVALIIAEEQKEDYQNDFCAMF